MRIGDRLLVVGPNRHVDGDTSAVEFRPGPAVRRFLIGADASAVPAAIGIAERLPDATGAAVRWVLTTSGHGDALFAATVEAAADIDRRAVAFLGYWRQGCAEG